MRVLTQGKILKKGPGDKGLNNYGPRTEKKKIDRPVWKTLDSGGASMVNCWGKDADNQATAPGQNWEWRKPRGCEPRTMWCLNRNATPTGPYV